MVSNLRLNSNLNATPQPVMDQANQESPLALSVDQVQVNNPGNGNILLNLGSERSWVFKQLGSGSSTALELTAANPNNNNKNFVINTDGRVGIGTQAPAAKLHVEGGQIVVRNAGDGNVLLTLGSERSWVFKQIGTGAGTALELTAATPENNNKNFIINTEGRVGIGTRNPQAKLHVEGNIHVTDDIVLVPRV